MSKRKDYNKLQLVKEIQEAANLYKKNLIGRKFLYVFDERYIEVIYTIKGFKHLTGVESSLSAKSFYDNAVNNKLSVSNINFSSQHPYELCVRKVCHLKQLYKLASGEGFLLQEILTNTQTFKFGATDLDFTLLFNPIINSATGTIINECLHVESLRDEDCFKKSQNVYEITHILSKANNEPFYNTIHYIDAHYSLKELPDKILIMIDDSIKE